MSLFRARGRIFRHVSQLMSLHALTTVYEIGQDTLNSLAFPRASG